MNAFDPALFAVTAPCMPCCASAECACALLLPPLASPYADYATAAAVLADTEAVYDCFAYVDNAGLSGITSSTVVDSGSSIAFSQAFSSAPGQTGVLWLSINGYSGNTWSFAYTGNGTPGMGDPAWAEAIYIEIYDCAGTLLDTIDTGATGISPATYTLPADGTYYIKLFVYCTLFVGTCFDTASATFTSTGSYSVNPVIALWDDSGTTRQLEACPKLLLPILTESTGDWYADCAAADAVLTDSTLVSNCVGYCETFFWNTFTATDGGTSLTFAQTNSPFGMLSNTFWGSVNAEAGETLDFACTGQTVISFEVYDYTGTLIDSASLAPTPVNSATLPYSGRYIVKLTASQTSPPPPLSMTATITSSGTMSVNPIQALYDSGISCASRLNCGDSCP